MAKKLDIMEVIQRIPGYDPVATAGDCTFDAEAARLALDFFPELLKHVKGAMAGQPFELEPWQQAIVANLFGWKRPDGTRRYRRALVFVPRKCGKTTLAAGILLYTLFCDGEPGAEVYGAASDREQARLLFDQAAGMVVAEPTLKERAVVYSAHNGSKSIVLKDHSGSYRTISAEAHTKHGYNTHMAVIDEVHAQPNRELVDVLETSTGSRTQPLMLYITTADFARPSICNELRDYAGKVRDGIIDDEGFLPVIYEASIEDDWTDPDVWAKANPNLGKSLSAEYLAQECQRAQEVPEYENTFKRLHLNITTEQAERWIQMDRWDACGGAVSADDLAGQPCYAGLDLSSTRDVTALMLYFPDGHQVVGHYWVPDDNAHEREKRDRVPYLTWARQGLVTLTPGNVIDYDFVIARVKEAASKFNVREVAYDPWNARQTAIALQDAGLPMVEFQQGYKSMNEPLKELSRLIYSRELRHGGDPVLRWMAANVAIVRDPADNIKAAKDKSADRIDGIVALAMAIGRAIAQGGEGASVYEERGILYV